MNNLIVIDREKLIDLCPYAGGHSSKCKKKKRLGCSYLLGGCYFDDIEINFDDDDGQIQ